MASAHELMALGIPAAAANAIGRRIASGLTATGSTKGTALALIATHNKFSSVAASTGSVLPPAVGAPTVVIENDGASALSVYANSTDTINALSAGAAFSVTNGKVAIFIPHDNTWAAVLSA